MFLLVKLPTIHLAAHRMLGHSYLSAQLKSPTLFRVPGFSGLALLKDQRASGALVFIISPKDRLINQGWH
jgi:hypothetical protein